MKKLKKKDTDWEKKLAAGEKKMGKLIKKKIEEHGDALREAIERLQQKLVEKDSELTSDRLKNEER